MAFEEYTYSGTQRLRRGYTTGTCAALAAKAGAISLLSGQEVETVSIMTPAGIEVCVSPRLVSRTGNSATFAVIKDAGDDYDVTDKADICATVSLSDVPGIRIDGGKGVGRVTQPGLDQPQGSAAINSGPRKMIKGAVREVFDETDYAGGADVVVEVPAGEELAKKTFNPQIGIEGGISILGTSGIVEPQSLAALMASLEVEVHSLAARGFSRLVVTPGNYGQNFLFTLGFSQEIPVVKCANFIGNTLDCAVREGFKEVLLVGHIGKMVKVAGGVMDTHSRMADCRREILAAHAAYAGVPQPGIARIFEAVTADACLDIIEGFGKTGEVLARIVSAIQDNISRRTDGACDIGAVIFSNKTGLLGMSDQASALIERWKAA